jgi:hypothetical protein
MVLKRPVTVYRNGLSIGEFSTPDLPGLLAKGELLESDECLPAGGDHTTPLPEYISSSSIAAFQQPVESREEAFDHSLPAPFPAGRGVPPVASLAGWILFLVTFAILCGAVAWILTLESEKETALASVERLTGELRASRSEAAQSLLPEELQSTTVLGRVALQGPDGKPAPMPGFSIQLLKRRDVEPYLEQKIKMLGGPSALESQEGLNALLNGLPEPTLKTVTDSAGAYSFTLPDEADYVVYSSMSQPRAEGGVDVLIWLQSVSKKDAIVHPVNLTEKNRITIFAPELMISPGR